MERRPDLAIQAPSARTVARPAASGDIALLVVVIDGGRYGFRLEDVVEVQRMVQVVVLPGAPPVVEGVIDLRGLIVPVLDLRSRFGLPPATPTAREQLVVALAGSRTVAVRVDAAVGVRHVPQGDIDGAAGVPGVVHVAGVARDDDGLVVIHDLSTFLGWDEERRLDEALRAEEEEG